MYWQKQGTRKFFEQMEDGLVNLVSWYRGRIRKGEINRNAKLRDALEERTRTHGGKNPEQLCGGGWALWLWRWYSEWRPFFPTSLRKLMGSDGTSPHCLVGPLKYACIYSFTSFFSVQWQWSSLFLCGHSLPVLRISCLFISTQMPLQMYLLLATASQRRLIDTESC